MNQLRLDLVARISVAVAAVGIPTNFIKHIYELVKQGAYACWKQEISLNHEVTVLYMVSSALNSIGLWV